MGETTTLRIVSDVDAHWRGAYDILVRPSGARLDLEATSGVVEPNFLEFAGRNGVTLAQVDAIRAIGEVELAAPVSFLGFTNAEASVPIVTIDAWPSEPTLYRIALTLESDDGIGPRTVQREDDHVLLGPRGAGDVVSDAGSGSAAMDGSMYALGARAAIPAIRVPILAVDPAAERALLGPSAAFLIPLESVEATSRTAETFDHDLIPDEFRGARRDLVFAASTEASEQYSDEQAERFRSRAVLPIVVSAGAYQDLRLALDVTQVGQPLDHMPAGADGRSMLDAAAEEAGTGEVPLGSSKVDVGALMRPLQVASVQVPWPLNDDQVAGQAGDVALAYSQTSFEAELIDRPEYSPGPTRAGGSALSLAIEPQGLSAAPVTETLGGEAVDTNPEPLYHAYTTYDPALLRTYRAVDNTDRPFYWAPLGTFDLAALDLPDDPLSYVPFGAWDPPDTTYVAAPDGTPAGPVAMRPRLDPAGLVTLPPLAVTDIPSAVLLRGDAPIDAVRVRVAGVSDFSAASRARVEGVAAAIAALGLETDVVAGSSRQPVDLYVPGYFPGGGAQRDLGWVTQGWTTLGAAARVEAGLAGGVAALLALAVAAAAACAGGLQLMGVAGRRRDVAALRSFGWSRGQAMRWVLAEALVGAAAVLALAGAGWWLGGRSAAAAAAGLAIVVAYLGCAALAGLVAVARVERDGLAGLRAGDAWAGVPRRGRLAVRGAAGYGLRTLLARPGRTLARAAALAVTALAAAIGLAVVASTLARVGPTLLASALAASTERDRWALLAIVALAGLAGTLALGRLDGRDRAGEVRALRSAGWDGADLRRARLAMAAALGAAGAALAAPGAWLLAPAVPEQPSWVVVVLAVAASLVLALAVLPAVGTGSRREGMR